jgi:hypothetical protein
LIREYYRNGDRRQAGNRQQATGNRQQATGNRQQAISYRLQAPNLIPMLAT